MGDDPYEGVSIFGDKIFLAHARDLSKLKYPHRYDEVFLGEGDIDIPKTLILLDAIGYDGIICPSISARQGFEEKDLQARAVEYLKKFVRM